ETVRSRAPWRTAFSRSRSITRRHRRSHQQSSQGVLRRMTQVGTSKEMNPSRDEFAALLAESLAKEDLYEGSVVKGRIVGIEKDLAVIDVGLKTEGRVALREFSVGGKADLKVGDEVEVYLERVENALGE